MRPLWYITRASAAPLALSHRAVFNQLDAYARAIQLSPDDVICSWLPLYHDMGFIAAFIMPVLMGVPLVLMSPFDWVRAPYKLMQSVSKYRGTLSWLPNFAYNFCTQKIRDRQKCFRQQIIHQPGNIESVE